MHDIANMFLMLTDTDLTETAGVRFDVGLFPRLRFASHATLARYKNASLDPRLVVRASD